MTILECLVNKKKIKTENKSLIKYQNSIILSNFAVFKLLKGMKYNNEFKVIDTQEKAYLLGQIYGDGYNGCKENNKNYRFSMASINTDRDLYEKLNNLFPFLKLHFYKSHDNMVYLQNYEKAFCLDLKSLGMVSNKTDKDVTGEFHFPNIKEDLIPHFLRGYFDADGSAWYPNRVRSRNNLHIEFGCSTKNFLLSIKRYLDSKGIYFTYLERNKKAGNGKFYTSYTLLSSNSDTSLMFANLIYKDAIIYLPYKYEKCYKHKDLKSTAFEIYGKCPYCGGSHIIRVGVRANKRRLLCKECFKRFTRPLPN